MGTVFNCFETGKIIGTVINQLSIICCFSCDIFHVNTLQCYKVDPISLSCTKMSLASPIKINEESSILIWHNSMKSVIARLYLGLNSICIILIIEMTNHNGEKILSFPKKNKKNKKKTPKKPDDINKRRHLILNFNV